MGMKEGQFNKMYVYSEPTVAIRQLQIGIEIHSKADKNASTRTNFNNYECRYQIAFSFASEAFCMGI